MKTLQLNKRLFFVAKLVAFDGLFVSDHAQNAHGLWLVGASMQHLRGLREFLKSPHATLKAILTGP